ncbi:unnamed protein product [Prorocentrum cordatum]|uniref:Amino acid transporter transmembrane domain-containing protein n=1 Tax=Prorocentrum cordatum TaxID=2364126 RepID=A0ABN9RL26_9DINO|nr:unnamed protein product [Polarella glacialis]
MEDIQHIPGQEARQDAPWTGTSPTRRVAAGLKRTFTLTLESYAFGPAASFAPGLDSDDAGAFAEGYRACRTSSIRSSVLSEVGSMVPSRVPSRDWTPNDGTSSFSASVANLTKSMVGIGMLTLPRAFADCSVLLAVGALMFCGALSAVSFFLLGYCAHVTNTRTLPQLWEATVGGTSEHAVRGAHCASGHLPELRRLRAPHGRLRHAERGRPLPAAAGARPLPPQPRGPDRALGAAAPLHGQALVPVAVVLHGRPGVHVVRFLARRRRLRGGGRRGAGPAAVVQDDFDQLGC